MLIFNITVFRSTAFMSLGTLLYFALFLLGNGGVAVAQKIQRAPLPDAFYSQTNISSIIEKANTNQADTKLEDTDIAALTEGDDLRDNTDKLPLILTSRDRELYREIFALQEKAIWQKSNRLIAQIQNPILMGHVHFQKLMHSTSYRAKYNELKNWMRDYGDHPGAKRVYRLAKRRKPLSAALPKPVWPVEVPEKFDKKNQIDGNENSKSLKPFRSFKATRWHQLRNDLGYKTSPSKRKQILYLQRKIVNLVQDGQVTVAYRNLFNNHYKSKLDPVSLIEALGDIARGYFRYHKDQNTLDVARQAVQFAQEIKQDGLAWEAAWWGGLAAWRKDDKVAAYEFFNHAAQDDKDHTNSVRTAAAFWAGRSALELGRFRETRLSFEAASINHHDFYGLIAGAVLGLKPPPPTKIEFDNIYEATDFISARRALALREVGQISSADAELAFLYGRLNKDGIRLIMKLAHEAGLARAALKMSQELLNKIRTEARYNQNQSLSLPPHSLELFPIPEWAKNTNKDLTLDRALVVGFVRKESAFNPIAVSSAGARGLMQLMPNTASFIAKKRYNGSARKELLDPQLNLELGQLYLHHLLEEYDHNLIKTVAAYNAGPGNIRKWEKKMKHQDDPLLFIESIPSWENRNFVKGILRNFWSYRHKYDQSSPSLFELSQGMWPRYQSIESKGKIE